MLTSIFSAVALLAADAAATIYYAGVAESSGEFGVWSMFFSCLLPIDIWRTGFGMEVLT
jgi:hypothetical protein